MLFLIIIFNIIIFNIICNVKIWITVTYTGPHPTCHHIPEYSYLTGEKALDLASPLIPQYSWEYQALFTNNTRQHVTLPLCLWSHPKLQVIHLINILWSTIIPCITTRVKERIWWPGILSKQDMNKQFMSLCSREKDHLHCWKISSEKSFLHMRWFSYHRYFYFFNILEQRDRYCTSLRFWKWDFIISSKN